jgi:hypothetical protein
MTLTFHVPMLVVVLVEMMVVNQLAQLPEDPGFHYLISSHLLMKIHSLPERNDYLYISC